MGDSIIQTDTETIQQEYQEGLSDELCIETQKSKEPNFNRDTKCSR